MPLKEKKDLNIAVVGAGVSGITTAYILDRRHRVTLFEKNDYFGGHTHTIVLKEGPDPGIAVDTGFIVLNQRTYPHFLALLAQLGAEVRPTDMSFGYYCERTGLCYASSSLDSVFAQRKNLFRFKYWRFLFELATYLKDLRRDYQEGRLEDVTLSEYIRQKGLHQEVKEQFIIPMAAAIWSASDLQMGEFPVKTFARFYENHGLLSLTGHPPWYTVKGGSHTYVNRFLEKFSGRAVKNARISGIRREEDRVEVRFSDQAPQSFDAVILACHADEALELLEDPSEQEKRLLGAWTYSNNKVYLHTDSAVMPPSKRAWASWNYIRRMDSAGGSPVTVTYDMNRLQGLETSTPYFVTLNPAHPISKGHVIKELNYTHPEYSFETLGTQKELPSLNGYRNTFFCGSYFSYGFHEDGVKSALAVGSHFGEGL